MLNLQILFLVHLIFIYSTSDFFFYKALLLLGFEMLFVYEIQPHCFTKRKKMPSGLVPPYEIKL